MVLLLGDCSLASGVSIVNPHTPQDPAENVVECDSRFFFIHFVTASRVYTALVHSCFWGRSVFLYPPPPLFSDLSISPSSSINSHTFALLPIPFLISLSSSRHARLSPPLIHTVHLLPVLQVKLGVAGTFFRGVRSPQGPHSLGDERRELHIHTHHVSIQRLNRASSSSSFLRISVCPCFSLP